MRAELTSRWNKNIWLGEPIHGKISDDYSDEFDLPLSLADLMRIRSTHPAEDRLSGLKSPSEGRSVHLPPVVFQRQAVVNNRPTVLRYIDISLKGVGGEGDLGGRVQVLPTVESEGTHYQAMYSIEPIEGFPFAYGFAEKPACIYDLTASRHLERSYGLRTRALICQAEVPEDIPCVTPDGRQTFKTYYDRRRTPVVEAWAIRCRYRLTDLAYMNYERGVRKSREQGFTVEDYSKMRQNNVMHTPESVNLDKQDQEYLQGQYFFLATELLLRCNLDTDKRFKDLANRYAYLTAGDSYSAADLHNFFTEFMMAFSAVHGIQTGILTGSKTLANGMNKHNNTLMAELVDHMTTYYPRELTEEEEFGLIKNHFQQLVYLWSHIPFMMREFGRAGVVDSEALSLEYYLNLQDNFLEHYFGYLQANTKRHYFSKIIAYLSQKTAYHLPRYNRVDTEDFTGNGLRPLFLQALQQHL